MANIVLAHGILGCGSILWFKNGIYFNGVAKLYRSKGHDVLETTVSCLGSLKTRTEQLAAAIQAKWPDDEPIHIVAHSMGGLDSRRLIEVNQVIGSRVKTLITIATPHLGSPVANAQGLYPFIRQWFGGLIRWFTPAFKDLQVRHSLQNSEMASVKYITIACDKSRGTPGSPLFALTRFVGGLESKNNDGVVTFKSASPAGNSPSLVWPVDHGEAIGWPTGYGLLALIPAALKPSKEHLARYEKLLTLLA